jgi:hypothetical protein
MHEFFRRWRPQLILAVEKYPSRTRNLNHERTA